MNRLLRACFIVASLAIAGPPALAQESLVAAKAQGLVGERPDGLIGAVAASPSAEIRALVERVNRERRAVYAGIAQRERTSADVVQRTAGERLVRETPAGQFFMDPAGAWRRR